MNKVITYLFGLLLLTVQVTAQVTINSDYVSSSSITGNLSVQGTTTLTGAATMGTANITTLNASAINGTITGTNNIALSNKWAAPVGGMSFDGVNDKVEVPTSASLNVGTGDFSIEAYVKFIEHKSAYLMIKLDGTSGYVIQTGENGEIYPRLKPSGGSLVDYATSPVTTTLNTWHHVLLSFDRDGNYVGYLDGRQITSLAISASAGDLSSTADLTINTTGAIFNKNEIAYLRIYKKALTATEAYEHWNNGTPWDVCVSDTTLKLEIMPDGFGSNIVFDRSGNENNGVVTGGTSLARGTYQLYRDGVLARATDWTATNVVPKGYILKAILVTNNTATPMTLNVGTTGGGTDVVNGATITASVTTYIEVNKLFSYSADQTLYFDDSGGWQSVNIRLIMEKM